MKREFLLRFASMLAVTGLVAYRLATAPVTGMDIPPISAGMVAGFPLVPGSGITAEQAVPISHETGDSMSLEKAFTPQTTVLLGARALDLTARDQESTTNVHLSADAADFTVLQPNEVFSFNKIVGIRTTDRGYRTGLMYSNGQLVSGIGGGICITSTALYNVALETGMKIIERHPHSGPVAYADPGRDGAVAYGALDLQFKNNTGGVVFIRSIVSDSKLVVAFYGKKQPGREVEIATEDFEPIPFDVVQKEDATVPEGQTVVSQQGKPGYLATTVRIIKQDGKIVSREMISRDVVRARNEIVLVHGNTSGTGTPMEYPLDLLPFPSYTPRSSMTDVPLALPEPPLQSGNAWPMPEQKTDVP